MFSEELIDIIKQELNVKEVLFSYNDLPEGYYREYLPKLPELGKKYNKQLSLIKEKLKRLTDDEYVSIIENGYIEVENTDIKLYKEDIIVNIKSDNKLNNSKTFDNIVVTLDTKITDDLKKEGFINEVINRIQNIRKNKNLSVNDIIDIRIFNFDSVLYKDTIDEYKNLILSEVQGRNLLLVDDTNIDYDIFDINDIKLEINLYRI